MALNYFQLKNTVLPPTHQALQPDSCIVYALGVGAGIHSPTSLGDETKFIYEEKLQVLPTQAAVMAYPGFWMRDEMYGLDWRRIVNAELRLTLLGPLPFSGDLVGCTQVSGIHDKGPNRGAIVHTTRRISDSAGQELAVVEQLNFCRGDGGYSGGDSSQSDELPYPIERPPQTNPASVAALQVGHQQAAIYRLTGDRNPLHIDPEAAKAAGYPAPILHGAATAGMVCRVLANHQPERESSFLSGFQLRFTGILFPGEVMKVALWSFPDSHVAFLCNVIRGDTELEVAYGTAQWADLA